MADDVLTVRDVMVANVRTVFPETPSVRAAEVMVRSGIRHLAVTDADGKVVGVLTQRDVLKHLSPWLSKAHRPDGPPPRCEVREFMSAPAITVRPHVPVREAAALMASRKIGCLPVVNEHGGLAGILSSVDLLKRVASDCLPMGFDELKRFVPPASIAEDDNINLPKGYVAELKFDHAVLGYAAASKRIGVRLFLKGKDHESLNGARRVKLSDEHVVIPARDFLHYHRIEFRGEMDVTHDEESGYFLLSPRLPRLKPSPVPSRTHSGFPFREP